MYLRLEPAMNAVFAYLIAQMPARITQMNTEVTDGLTLSDFAKYDINSLPDLTVISEFLLNVVDIEYFPIEFGVQDITIQFAIYFTFIGADVKSNNTVLHRYLDAIQNLFFSDITLGGNVIGSEPSIARKKIGTDRGECEIMFKAMIELK
jgi:hypothetical protein